MKQTDRISDSEMQEVMRQNQKEFIEHWESSVLGKLYHLYWKLKKDTDEQTLSDEDYIEKINRLRFRNRCESLIYRLKTVKHHLSVHSMAPGREAKHNDYLSVACIIKNEGLYMKEWLDFHLAAGVERFYIFDNGSTDNTLEVLEPYVKAGIVHVIHYPGKRVQIWAYNDALRICRKNTRWLAFIDADEFLFPVEKSDLKELLKEYEQEAALGVNWVVYGTCGHVQRPEGDVIRNYTMTYADRNHEMNCRIKTIIQPKETLCMASPHYGIYRSGQLCVNEKHEPVTGAAMYRSNGLACSFGNSIEKIRLNHYWTKSLEELQAKCGRGYGANSALPRQDAILKRLDYPLMEDDSAQLFLKRINRA